MLACSDFGGGQEGNLLRRGNNYSYIHQSIGKRMDHFTEPFARLSSLNGVSCSILCLVDLCV